MRVALVVQRYGREVLGGSEALARQYAAILQESCTVEVLTTCALDHRTWRNHYPAGVTQEDGVTVHRFATDFERGRHWWELWQFLLHGLDFATFPGSPAAKAAFAERLASLPEALQEELLLRQGPCSTPLLDHLARQRRDYDAFVFFTYLYPTTYFGIRAVPPERAILCPTLHDEPMAYLPAFRDLFHRPRTCLYLSRAERALAQRLHGVRDPGHVVGMAVPFPGAVPPPPRGTPDNYVLYAGRIEGAKGVNVLFHNFLTYKQRHPSDLKLVLIGSGDYPVPRHPDLVYRGFVSDADKFAYMKGARLFLHPSGYESFAIVLLESFLMGTPALVNGHNEVLREHCEQSGAGALFGNEDEFCEVLHHLLVQQRARQAMGRRGRQYVRKRFPLARIAGKLQTALAEVCAPPRQVSWAQLLT